MCSDELFIKLQKESTNWKELASKLCENDFKSRSSLGKRAERLGLDKSHFRRIRKISDNALKEAIASSASVRQALQSLGVNSVGANHTLYSKRVVELGISTEHFARVTPRAIRKAEEILILRPEGSDRISGRTLKSLLLKSGVPYECASCAESAWQGKDLPLQVDHKNGKRWDDRAENLWFLCANCHVLKTYGESYGRQVGPVGLEPEDILVRREPGAVRAAGYHLRWALMKKGLANECGQCGITEHQGKKIRLEVDHKERDVLDNRMEALWMLCPNCHSIKTSEETAALRAAPTKCTDCSAPITRKSSRCRPCAGKESRAASRIAAGRADVFDQADLNEWHRRLVEDNISYERLGRELGISGNALKNRLKRRGRALPQRRKVHKEVIKWPPAEDLFLRLVENGETLQKVAQGLGIDRATLKKHLNKKGYVLPLKRIDWPAPSEVFKMWSGAKKEDRPKLAGQLGASDYRTIRSFLKRHGYTAEQINNAYAR